MAGLIAIQALVLAYIFHEEWVNMITRLVGLALLSSAISFGSGDLVNAMPSGAAGNPKATLSTSSGGNGWQQVHGWWLAVPLIIGAAIILDDHYRHSPGTTSTILTVVTGARGTNQIARPR